MSNRGQKRFRIWSDRWSGFMRSWDDRQLATDYFIGMCKLAQSDTWPWRFRLFDGDDELAVSR